MKLASPLCAVALMCGTAMGADYHWTGAAGDHLWSTAGNWTDSSGNAVAAPKPDTAYTYNFTQSAFADNAFIVVVTQDINVVFGTAIAVHGAGSSAETTEVTFVSANGCTLSTSTTDALNVYLYSNSRLTWATDMSADASGKDISKIGEGELVFDLKAANTAMRNVYIKSGPFRIAATGARPLIRVGFDTSATESNGAVFENDKSGMTLGGLYASSALSVSRRNIGRIELNGWPLNVGDDSASTSTNLLPVPVFADGGTLALQNERRVYLEGLPIGGTLAVDRADAQVVARRTAVRWLFDDADNPLKDVVGSGERVLAPAGMPEVVEDSVRGKVLSISGGKYLKGPDADAGLAELQPQPTNNPYTVAFWFKPDAACDNLGKIFYWGVNTNGKSAALRLNNAADKGLMFTVWGNNRTLATAASPRDGDWHHFAVTYNGIRTFRVYYDGKRVDSFTSDIYYPPNKNFYVGRVYGGWVANGANPYTGLLDDFLIGSYELPAERIAKLHADGLAATVAVGSVEAKSAGEVAFAKENVNLARLSGNALAGGVTLQAEGTTLTVGAEGTAGDDLYRGRIDGADAALVKEGADYALELSGPAAAVTNVTVKEGTLSLRRPLARRGLVCRYSFDEASRIGRDSSPAGLNLTPSKAAADMAAIPDGVSGGAVRFSGNANWLTTDTDNRPASFPRGNGSFSVSFWMRPTAAACAGRMDVFVWGQVVAKKCVLFRLDSPTSFVVSHWTSPNLRVDVPDMTDGEWHHVVWTYDGETRRRVIYFDGMQKGEDTYDSDLTIYPAFNMTLGYGKKTENAYYSGDLDEFMVFDYPWTASEVADEYARKAPATVAAESLLPAPVAHWTFDDDANPGADSSANGLSLTQVGDVTLESGDCICGKAARLSSSSGSFMLDEFPSVFPASSNAFSVVVRYRADTTQASGYTPCLVMWGDLDTWADGRLVKVGTAKSVNFSIYTRVGKALFSFGGGGYYRTAMGTDRMRWLTQTIVYSPQEGGDSHITRLYVDGEFAGESTAKTVDVAAQSFAIGANYPSGQNFYGLIDDVQIYDCTLSSGQVRLIAERLEASKGVAGGASAPASTLLREPPVAVASGATLRVASAERVAALSGAGTVKVSPLASLTVSDMRGFSGSLVGYGTVTVEKGATLDRRRVSVADTLTVHALGVGMTVIIR